MEMRELSSLPFKWQPGEQQRQRAGGWGPNCQAGPAALRWETGKQAGNCLGPRLPWLEALYLLAGASDKGGREGASSGLLGEGGPSRVSSAQHTPQELSEDLARVCLERGGAPRPSSRLGGKPCAEGATQAAVPTPSP